MFLPSVKGGRGRAKEMVAALTSASRWVRLVLAQLVFGTTLASWLGFAACPMLCLPVAKPRAALPRTCPLPVPAEHRAGAGVLPSAIKYWQHLCGVQRTSLHRKYQVSRERIWSETFLLLTDTNLSLLMMMIKAFQVLCGHLP